MEDEGAKSLGLGGKVVGYFYPLSLTLYISASIISMTTFVYGVTLSYLQPQVRQNYVLRVMIAAQFFNSYYYVIRVLLVDVELTADSACRVVLFMSDSMVMLPVNLCVQCAVYIQLVVIHNVSLELRWPRVVTLAVAVAMSLVPPSMILYLPPRLYRRDSACSYSWIPNSLEYGYVVYAFSSWAYLSGVIGFVSVLTIAIHLMRTRRANHRILLVSATSLNQAQLMERIAHADTLHKTLLTIIWFPITPIISLWFNLLLITVAHYKQKRYQPLEIISLVLLCLQSVFLGVPLLINPTMRAALAKQLRERRQARRAAGSPTHSPTPPPPCPPTLSVPDPDL